jgi:hypothetical protein
LKKEHRGIIPGGAMVTGGVCSMYFQHYIRLISLVQKGRDYTAVQERGAAPRGEWPFAIDVKGGEIITLMRLMSIDGRD